MVGELFFVPVGGVGIGGRGIGAGTYGIVGSMTGLVVDGLMVGDSVLTGVTLGDSIGVRVPVFVGVPVFGISSHHNGFRIEL